MYLKPLEFRKIIYAQQKSKYALEKNTLEAAVAEIGRWTPDTDISCEGSKPG
jgi:hypothetical protein